MSRRKLAAEIAALIEQSSPASGWVFLLVDAEAAETTCLSNRPDDLDLLGTILMDSGRRDRPPQI